MSITGTFTGGKVIIPSVTGNIVITATASRAAITSIFAVYEQVEPFYTDDNLSILRNDLTVFAVYEGGTTTEISGGYILSSGTIVEGDNDITVSYAGFTTTFNAIAISPQKVTLSWSGSGSARTTNIINATNHAVWWQIPFVSGDSRIASGATASGIPCLLKTLVYSDSSASTFVGYYYIDTESISSTSRTDADCPTLRFDKRIKVAPSGYYIKIYSGRKGDTPFAANDNYFQYINAHAKTVSIKH